MSRDATREEKVQGVIQEVRRLFHRLSNAADTLHEDLGVTASQRAVLETLVDGGPTTVPTIARDKRVTRQHIQTLVNRLADAGLVETVDNPAHRRSSLVRPTAAGVRLFERIRGRERPWLRAMARDFRRDDLDRTLATLRTMATSLDALRTSRERSRT